MEQLIECRAVLKNTYVLAYYMPASGEKTLFEYLQSDLDTVTEELSRLVEAEGKPEKMHSIQKTADARMRLRHFRDGVDNGFSSGGGGAGTSASASAGSAISALLGNQPADVARQLGEADSLAAAQQRSLEESEAQDAELQRALMASLGGTK